MREKKYFAKDSYGKQEITLREAKKGLYFIYKNGTFDTCFQGSSFDQTFQNYCHRYYLTPISTLTPNSPLNNSNSNNTPKNNWMNMAQNTTAEKEIKVYDASGNPLELGEKDEKASGGEGTIYNFAPNPNYLIKIYKPSILNNPQKMKEITNRLRDMSKIKALQSFDFLAWPKMVVYNQERQIIGFLMKKCEGNSLLSLRGPSNIKKLNPNWTRIDLVKIAIDYVQKVQELAKYNVYVNDFNPSNVLFDENGKVFFIDCDSFQIPTKDGGVNITKTYFASHVAPELLRNKSLLNQPRNIHHVEFGVALTVFQILMCGLHPYNYYDPTRKTACGTPDENLILGRCPLGNGSDCRFPIGNWYNLWSYFTWSLKNCFIKTFRKDEGHSNPNMRVSLEELEDELNKFLQTCYKDFNRQDLNPSVPKPKTDMRNSQNSEIL